MGAGSAASGPDFSSGIPVDSIPADGTLVGRVGDEAVLLSRFDGRWSAVGGACTHYGAALANGLIDGETVRCPLHHACFSLRTGAALEAPALDPLARWRVDVEGDRLFVRDRLPDQPAAAPSTAMDVANIVIIGGGAAGLACANALRRLGYGGAITMLSADSDPPVDRPNLSKDYLAGSAPEEWLPLRSPDWYRENRIEMHLGIEIVRVDSHKRTVHSASGDEWRFDRLLIATGSTANRLSAPGFDHGNVLTLRSLADSRAIAERVSPGTRVAIIGSSFIGLEAAAALRTRGAEVDIVSPEQVPFERVFGEQLGRFLQQLHIDRGVRFHLGRAAARFDGHAVITSDGKRIDADLVLLGIGARPGSELAYSAGLPGEDGIPVDEHLQSAIPGIFAAGDIAACPDPLGSERMRIEHWTTAQRQGEIAAANMLGIERRYEIVPFFWTEQYGVAVRYVGHARRWDRTELDGDLDSGSFIVRYFDGGEHRASAAVGRDLEILQDAKAFQAMIAERRTRCAQSREPSPPAAIEYAS